MPTTSDHRKRYSQPSPTLTLYSPQTQWNEKCSYEASAFGAPRLLKTYRIVDPSSFALKPHLLYQNGRPLLSIAASSRDHGATHTTMLQALDGRVLASAMFTVSCSPRIVLGGLIDATRDALIKVKREAKENWFEFRGGRFAWRVKRKRGLLESSYDYTFVEATAPGRVLGEYVKDGGFFSRGNEVGRFVWFVEVGDDLELLAMAAMYAVEKQKSLRSLLA